MASGYGRNDTLSGNLSPSLSLSLALSGLLTSIGNVSGDDREHCCDASSVQLEVMQGDGQFQLIESGTRVSQLRRIGSSVSHCEHVVASGAH